MRTSARQLAPAPLLLAALATCALALSACPKKKSAAGSGSASAAKASSGSGSATKASGGSGSASATKAGGGSGSTSAASSSGSTTAATPSGPINVLSLAKLTFSTGAKIDYIMQKGGVVEKADGTKVGRVTADGKLMRAGAVVATLNADGSIVAAGKQLPHRITADGALMLGRRKITFRENGSITGGNPRAPQVRVDGHVDAKSRRTAMFFLAAMFTGLAEKPAKGAKPKAAKRKAKAPKKKSKIK